MSNEIVCHVPDCKYNPNPCVGYCEAFPCAVLSFVEMGKAPREPILRCWSYKKKQKRQVKNER